ncbi:hypothetical protein ACYX7E_01125 [Luteimonas sp. RIT-PG2_3]
MTFDDTLSAVLEPLYASVLAPERLGDFSRALADATDSSITAIMAHDVVVGRAAPSLAHGIDHDWLMQRVAQCDLHKDPWMQRATPLLETGRVIDSHDMLPLSQMRHSQAYSEHYQVIGVAQQVVSVGHFDGVSSVTLSICHGDPRRRFGREAIDLLHRLTPHWVNAYALQRRLGWFEQRSATLDAAIEAAPMAMFLLDAQQQVVRSNAAAEQLLASSDLLHLDGGRPTARFNGGPLQRVLGESCQGMSPIRATTPSGNSANLRDAAGRVVLVASVRPLPQGAGHERAIMFVQPVQASTPDDLKQLLRQLFPLTESEAALVVTLHRHTDLAKAADSLGIATATAQTRLKVVFDKTGERSQPALMRLTSAVAMMLRPAGGSRTMS